MHVDKDLFGGKSKMYCPETCCILPKSINTYLTNCKKHYFEGQNAENTLPLGISYGEYRKKYFGTIQLAASGATTKLSYWETAEEAFAEYKQMKQADLILLALKYKDKIPDFIYKRLIAIDIKPY